MTNKKGKEATVIRCLESPHFNVPQGEFYNVP